MKLFTLAFWKQAAERAIVAGVSTFTASDFFAHNFTLRGLEVAASAAGMAALYTLIKAAGVVSATKAAASK